MTTEKAIEILTDHNKWRRAESEYAEVGVKQKYTPTEIGEAIEHVTNIFADVSKIEEIDAKAKGFADYYINEKEYFDRKERHALEFGFAKGMDLAKSKPKLTWQDIKLIVTIADNMFEQNERDELIMRGQQAYYSEILENFNAIKEYEV